MWYDANLHVCAHEGAEAVQKLIDAGAYIVFKEESGLEMLAEFTREVGADTIGSKKIDIQRDLVF